jgi:3-hydroxyisobutyrate dehydrogenase
MALQKAESGKTRIGWIGTGVMGRWMCGHAMAKGFKATIYNRSKDKPDVKALLDQGAKWADTPKQVAENSDVVFAIVGFPKDVRDVFLGAQGALAGSKGRAKSTTPPRRKASTASTLRSPAAMSAPRTRPSPS